MNSNLPAVIQQAGQQERPKRRTHREQKARTTWRYACHVLAALAFLYMVIGLVLSLDQGESVFLMALFVGVLGSIALARTEKVPAWWYDMTI